MTKIIDKAVNTFRKTARLVTRYINNVKKKYSRMVNKLKTVNRELGCNFLFNEESIKSVANEIITYINKIKTSFRLFFL